MLLLGLALVAARLHRTKKYSRSRIRGRRSGRRQAACADDVRASGTRVRVISSILSFPDSLMTADNKTTTTKQNMKAVVIPSAAKQPTQPGNLTNKHPELHLESAG